VKFLRRDLSAKYRSITGDPKTKVWGFRNATTGKDFPAVRVESKAGTFHLEGAPAEMMEDLKRAVGKERYNRGGVTWGDIERRRDKKNREADAEIEEYVKDCTSHLGKEYWSYNEYNTVGGH